MSASHRFNDGWRARCGALASTDHQRNLVAEALDERFSELGSDHPLAYSDDGVDRARG